MMVPTGGYVVLGAGGHARVILDCLSEIGFPMAVGIIERDEARWGEEYEGVRILGGDELLTQLQRKGVTSFILGIGSIGQGDARRDAWLRALQAGLEPVSVLHPSVSLSRRARLGSGVQLMSRAVVNAGSWLGDNVLVNSGAVVEHDCHLGNHVHVASGAVLASAVQVDDGAHIGAGSVVRQGIRIGERAVIGVGSAVVHDVLAGQVVAGVPARPLRSP